jgi:hypothetical protein
MKTETKPCPLSAETVAAIRACYATRGPYKGRLLAKAPKQGSAVHAAWQALMLAWNPYKASIFAVMMIRRGEHAAVFETTLAWAERNMHLRGSDRDRAALERLGAW